jgi:hypothetical protein
MLNQPHTLVYAHVSQGIVLTIMAIDPKTDTATCGTTMVLPPGRPVCYTAGCMPVP